MYIKLCLGRQRRFTSSFYHLSFYVTRMENKFYFTTLLLMALAFMPKHISCDRPQRHLVANLTQEITFGTQGNKPIFKRKVFDMALFWKWRFWKRQQMAQCKLLS